MDQDSHSHPPMAEPIAFPLAKYPPKFVANVRRYFGAKGDQWLRDLPGIVGSIANEWQLTHIRPYQLSINYVAEGTQADGRNAVLKILAPDDEAQGELHALRVFNGHGCVRLLRVSEDQRCLLLEQCQPGSQLASVPNDRARTQIAAHLYNKIWRKIPNEDGFIDLRDWFSAIPQKQARMNGKLPRALPKLAQHLAIQLLPSLFAASATYRLIHGDLHHFNILRHQGEWVAIDPKGVIGPAEYECGPLMLNPWPRLASYSNLNKTTADRLAILNEILGFDRQVILGWALCHCVLSVWWDCDEKTGSGGEYSATLARHYSALLK